MYKVWNELIFEKRNNKNFTHLQWKNEAPRGDDFDVQPRGQGSEFLRLNG